MNSPLLPASAAALCAALLLLLVRHLFTRSHEPTSDEKDIPITPRCDVEKGETPPPVSYVSDIKVGADIVDEVWPPVEREADEPAPTIGNALPDVALVWGLDYSFEPRPAVPAADRRPLMAYSHIASALGVDEPEPVMRPRSQSATSASLSPSTPTDTRPMRSLSLVSGIVSDWNSLSQSEQQAWATLSEAKTRSRSSNSRSRGYDS